MYEREVTGDMSFAEAVTLYGIDAMKDKFQKPLPTPKSKVLLIKGRIEALDMNHLPLVKGVITYISRIVEILEPINPLDPRNKTLLQMLTTDFAAIETFLVSIEHSVQVKPRDLHQIKAALARVEVEATQVFQK